MSELPCYAELTMEVSMRGGPVAYTDYDPRGVEGYAGTIAAAFNKHPCLTGMLLELSDQFKDDHHFSLEETPFIGPLRENEPRELRVVLRPA